MISEKQKEVVNFANEDGALLLSCGPVRSGKTFANVLGFLLYTQSQPKPLEHLILGKNVDTLTSAVIKPLREIAKGLGVDSHFRPHKSWLRIGKQTYHVRGGESNASAGAIQGLTCHSGLFDECTLYPREFWEMGLTRLSLPGSKLWASCNPEGPLHFIKTDFLDAGKFDRVYEFDLDKDNPSLTKDYIERTKSTYQGVFYERKIKGVWAAAEGLIYPLFKTAHIFSPGAGAKLTRSAISVDVGNATTTAILCGKAYSTNRAHICDEKKLEGRRGSGRTDDEIVQVVSEMAEAHDAEIVICDSAASSTIAALQSHPKRKFKVKRARKEVIPGIRHTGAALASGKVKISPKCQETIKELQSYQWAQGTEKPLKQNDHFCDALRYYTMSEIKRTINPGPVPLPAGL